MASDTPAKPQNDIGNYFGLYVTLPPAEPTWVVLCVGRRVDAAGWPVLVSGLLQGYLAAVSSEASSLSLGWPQFGSGFALSVALACNLRHAGREAHLAGFGLHAYGGSQLPFREPSQLVPVQLSGRILHLSLLQDCRSLNNQQHDRLTSQTKARVSDASDVPQTISVII